MLNLIRHLDHHIKNGHFSEDDQTIWIFSKTPHSYITYMISLREETGKPFG